MAEKKTIEIPSNKHEGKFKENVSVLTKMLGSEKNLIPSHKVNSEDLQTIINDLFADERKAKIEQVREKFKAVLGKYADYQKRRREKIKEFAKLDEQEQEAFNKAIQDLFNDLEDAKQRQGDIQGGVERIAGGEEPEKPASETPES